jgi:hypothetical protein
LGQGKSIVVTDEAGGIVNDPVLLLLEEDRFWLCPAGSDLELWARGVAVGRGPVLSFGTAPHNGLLSLKSDSCFLGCEARNGVLLRIDVHPVTKLRGPAAISLAPILGPVVDELAASTLDLGRVTVRCDWIQYRRSFREPVQLRSVLADLPSDADGTDVLVASGRGLEVAIDLRRSADTDPGMVLKTALAHRGDQESLPGTALEPWTPISESCIWRFNALYWQALAWWERAADREYEQALPGGRSDATDDAAAREIIFELLRVWDDLDARRALPEELYIVELGVGNGSQARTWLDTFAEVDRAHGRGYYRRLHYLMGDFSPHVLERARRAVGAHGDRVSSLVLDATSLEHTLAHDDAVRRGGGRR